jgi:methionyl-tRNA formyltransferase
VSKPRIVLVGAVRSSAALLEALVAAGGDVCAVLTLPPALGQRRHADYADLSAVASSWRVPWHYVDDLTEAESLLTEAAPDVLCVFGWSRLVSERVRSRARLGAIGFHPSPLPLGRGRHPLIWTILLGLERSASCFFKLGAGADDGDILVRRDFDLTPEETAGSLMEKAVEVGCRAVPDLLAHIEVRGLSGTPQNEADAVIWRKRDASDGRVDFRMSYEMIDRLVRALSSPYPGADAVHVSAGAGKVWRVAYATRPAQARFAEPGRVIGSAAGGPLVACADGAVVLREHSFTAPLEQGTWFI